MRLSQKIMWRSTLWPRVNEVDTHRVHQAILGRSTADPALVHVEVQLVRAGGMPHVRPPV